LAATAPLGWNSWYSFGGKVSDVLIRQQADLLVSLGLKDLGFTYVNLDDTWAGGRDESGNLFPDPARFPNGIGALADYLHSRGFKLGIYSSPASTTCAGLTGSLGHEYQDAATFAKWGVDFLKYDFCGVAKDYTAAGCWKPPTTAQQVAQLMALDLQSTGRPIVYSLSDFGIEADWARYAGANMWRIGQDTADNWNTLVYNSFDRLTGSVSGQWQDPDLLTIGLGGMTDVEYRTAFNLFAVYGAPIILSTDLRTLRGTNLETASNSEVIAVDQDQAGGEVKVISSDPCGSATCSVVIKRLSGTKPPGTKRWAVVFVNLDTSPHLIHATWNAFAKGPMAVRDVWRHSDLGWQPTEYSVVLEGHSSSMIIASNDFGSRPVPPTSRKFAAAPSLQSPIRARYVY
jgi:alpha-galactosidase